MSLARAVAFRWLARSTFPAGPGASPAPEYVWMQASSPQSEYDSAGGDELDEHAAAGGAGDLDDADEDALQRELAALEAEIADYHGGHDADLDADDGGHDNDGFPTAEDVLASSVDGDFHDGDDDDDDDGFGG